MTKITTINAKELYKSFLPFGDNHDLVKQCYFRGESSNKYKLLPSIFRDQIQKKWNIKSYDLQTDYGQIQLERDILLEFYENANRHGLAIPDVKDKLQKELNYWPDKDIIPLIALAQHYGTPTRLLDWSYDYKVALYFAAIGACKKKKTQKDYMILWALKKNAFENSREEDVLQKTVPVYANNPNLHAQQGLFVYYQFHDQTIDKSHSSQRLPLTKEFTKNIHKFKIPYHDRYELLKLLDDDGINAASIFPGYSGASQAVYEKMFYLQD